MIRRRSRDAFRLISQHDHGLLSGRLAEEYGNAQFAALVSPGPVLQGISLHDCGWLLHDDAPTVNDQHLPIDVFESTRKISLLVWPASAERAAAIHPYAGLLVSLHVLNLSALASQPGATGTEKMELDLPKQRFELNRFQHGEIERQERLRQTLGLSNAIPRRMGLAETSTDERERKLTYDFHILQAMDKLSLAICCTTVPNEQVSPLQRQPGGEGLSLIVHRPSDELLTVRPWPFRVERIEIDVPYRQIPDREYESDSALRETFDGARLETFGCVVKPA